MDFEEELLKQAQLINDQVMKNGIKKKQMLIEKPLVKKFDSTELSLENGQLNNNINDQGINNQKNNTIQQQI